MPPEQEAILALMEEIARLSGHPDPVIWARIVNDRHLHESADRASAIRIIEELRP